MVLRFSILFFYLKRLPSQLAVCPINYTCNEGVARFVVYVGIDRKEKYILYTKLICEIFFPPSLPRLRCQKNVKCVLLVYVDHTSVKNE